MSASLLALPLELQHHCLLAGSARDAMSSAATCRNFHAATHVSEIWQAFAARLPTHVSDPAKEVPMHARRYFRMAAAAVVCFEGVDGETPPGFRVASDGLSATNGEHGECNVFLRVPEMACPLRLTLDMPDTVTAEHFPFEHAIVMGADSFNHQGEQAAFTVELEGLRTGCSCVVTGHSAQLRPSGRCLFILRPGRWDDVGDTIEVSLYQASCTVTLERVEILDALSMQVPGWRQPGRLRKRMYVCRWGSYVRRIQ